MHFWNFNFLLQVVDMALLVKQDKKSLYGDPLTKDAPNVCINYYHQISAGSGITSPPSSTPGAVSPVQVHQHVEFPASVILCIHVFECEDHQFHIKSMNLSTAFLRKKSVEVKLNWHSSFCFILLDIKIQ